MIVEVGRDVDMGGAAVAVAVGTLVGEAVGIEGIVGSMVAVAAGVLVAKGVLVAIGVSVANTTSAACTR